MNGVFSATILHCKAILCRGQPGLMRWTLLRINLLSIALSLLRINSVINRLLHEVDFIPCGNVYKKVTYPWNLGANIKVMERVLEYFKPHLILFSWIKHIQPTLSGSGYTCCTQNGTAAFLWLFHLCYKPLGKMEQEEQVNIVPAINCQDILSFPWTVACHAEPTILG